MKRIYTILIASLLCSIYLVAQDRIYVHKSAGEIEAYTTNQLDSIRFVDSDNDLQIQSPKDTIRVGESIGVKANILKGSEMDISWTSTATSVASISGSYLHAEVIGLAPGVTIIKATCDGHVATYPITVIGKATSTHSPKVYWNIKDTYIRSGNDMVFTAQYDSKDVPVDYTAVWYDVIEYENRTAYCPRIKSLSYTYTDTTSRTIKSLSQIKKFEHNKNLWSDSTQSYLYTSAFPVNLDDTLCAKYWGYSKDTAGFALNIKSYLGADFPTAYKEELTKKLNPSADERNYSAYMEVFNALGLLNDTVCLNNRDSMTYAQWMTDSTFDKNSNSWKKHFKLVDSVFSTTEFETKLKIDTTFKVSGRPPKRDTTWFYDTTYFYIPVFESMKYVYPDIVAKVDQLWRDSVSYLDLLLGEEGYYMEYDRTYHLNAELRVYDKQGNYNKTTSEKITVGDVAQKIQIITDADPIIAQESSLTLRVGEFYTNRTSTIQYTWLFPVGTVDATTREAIASCTGESTPQIIFNNVGSQTIILQVTINGVRQPDEEVFIPVGYSTPTPTLYYSTQKGNVMAYKLINNMPSNVSNAPIDLGNYAQHAFNIFYHDSYVYVLDAGKQFYYVNDVNGNLGDGKISVVAKDGSDVQTMITNVGQAAFDDPFYGYIEDGHLYYANRNTGMVKLPLTERDKVYNITNYPWYVQQATLGYYNNGWGYGTIGGVFGKIKGVWHWTRFYNGNGIYRFEDSDILASPITQGDDTNKPKAGIMLEGMAPKSFAYIPSSDKICVHIMDAGYNGVYVCTYSELEAVGSSKNAIKPYAITYDGKMFASNTEGNLSAVEGTGSESVGICQMVYDEANDCVYFGYRNNTTNKDNNPPTGIYRYNVASGTVDLLLEGVSAYGITINNTPTQLF